MIIINYPKRDQEKHTDKNETFFDFGEVYIMKHKKKDGNKITQKIRMIILETVMVKLPTCYKIVLHVVLNNSVHDNLQIPQEVKDYVVMLCIRL